MLSHLQGLDCPIGTIAIDLQLALLRPRPVLAPRSRQMLQTFSGVDVKHQFRARAPGPPRVTAPVTTTVLPRLCLQNPGGTQEEVSRDIRQVAA